MPPPDVLSAMTSRHCKRAFLDRAVPRALLAEVLLAAGHAPSSRNTQLWQATVVSGSALEALVAALCAAFDGGEAPHLEYPGRPPELGEDVERRARDAGSGVLRARGTAVSDARARRALLRDNLRFYGAPVALICHLPRTAVAGTFLEMGFFLQNVMLGLVAHGLGSCPQASVAGYADILRKELGIGTDRLIVCTLAVGYPDEAAPVNRFVPQRAGLEEFTQWHGW
ncbi:nitroreductase [Streptomyces natalensis]|uniref:Nitroreductase domain-containing protein n=1 Tax=Streptomyces natalensis ATCC 27448 TaxID=1240678 RepID=A0A0D7CIX8_9ACTN|nr:nitroreductase [Streptomyces natalensis]KIZ16021.1 hypothetical protein SNA_22555 [Streptomyces natalensis ATCC 27448]